VEGESIEVLSWEDEWVEGFFVEESVEGLVAGVLVRRGSVELAEIRFC
jgi:hypothetical protein